ncbi:MAG: type II toxin-antitoxin system HicB family antitoxin [Chloroflexi bacterium]|nr:type II toxin-antitoxin system HicB family antitoxin [Chloroflexota bacterium]
MVTVQPLEEVIIPITIDYLEEDAVYQVSCPWLQGCHAWSETLDEAMRAIPGNIRAMLDARRANGSPIPPQLLALKSEQHFRLRVTPA